MSAATASPRWLKHLKLKHRIYARSFSWFRCSAKSSWELWENACFDCGPKRAMDDVGRFVGSREDYSYEGCSKLAAPDLFPASSQKKGSLGIGNSFEHSGLGRHGLLRYWRPLDNYQDYGSMSLRYGYSTIYLNTPQMMFFPVYYLWPEWLHAAQTLFEFVPLVGIDFTLFRLRNGNGTTSFKLFIGLAFDTPPSIISMWVSGWRVPF